MDIAINVSGQFQFSGYELLMLLDRTSDSIFYRVWIGLKLYTMLFAHFQYFPIEIFSVKRVLTVFFDGQSPWVFLLLVV